MKRWVLLVGGAVAGGVVAFFALRGMAPITPGANLPESNPTILPGRTFTQDQIP